MSKLNYTVDLFRNDRLRFIILTKDIGTKDLELGDQSPIKNITNMDVFRKTQLTTADLLEQVRKLHNDGQMKTELAYQLIGIFKGQDRNTPNTIYSNMMRMKPILITAYYENREELQKFGFIVVKGKTGNKISLPNRSPYDMLKSADLCIAYHKKLGNASPLKAFDMKSFEEYGKEAHGYINYANEKHREAESINEELNHILGFATGQNIRTKGTMYYFVARIRDTLLALHYDSEKQLEDWGFEVTVSTSKKKKEEEES
jgi:uncharacterized protein YqgQ